MKVYNIYVNTLKRTVVASIVCYCGSAGLLRLQLLSWTANNNDRWKLNCLLLFCLRNCNEFLRATIPKETFWKRTNKRGGYKGYRRFYVNGIVPDLWYISSRTVNSAGFIQTIWTKDKLSLYWAPLHKILFLYIYIITRTYVLYYYWTKHCYNK